MAKAIWNGVLLAESDETIKVEGNHYFPLEAVKKEYLQESRTHTVGGERQPECGLVLSQAQPGGGANQRLRRFLARGAGELLMSAGSGACR